MQRYPEIRGGAGECPVHGPLAPGWTTCPICEREQQRQATRGGERPTRSAKPEKPRPLPERDDETIARSGRGGRRADETVQRKRRVPPTEQVERPPQLLAWLIVKEGRRIGHVFPLQADGTDIGRESDNHIVIDDTKVSATHAKVKFEPEMGLTVWDLASANGTFVNGERVMAPVTVQENDEIKVGDTVLVLKTLEQ